MIKHCVRVVRMDSNVEEEVDVEVEGYRLTCFAGVCPRAISLGNVYVANLSLWAADGLELRQAESHELVGLTRLRDGFSYKVIGILEGPTLDAGVQFFDAMFAKEYSYLSGHMVKLEADRLQLAFE